LDSEKSETKKEKNVESSEEKTTDTKTKISTSVSVPITPEVIIVPKPKPALPQPTDRTQIKRRASELKVKEKTRVRSMSASSSIGLAAYAESVTTTTTTTTTPALSVAVLDEGSGAQKALKRERAMSGTLGKKTKGWRSKLMKTHTLDRTFSIENGVLTYSSGKAKEPTFKIPLDEAKASKLDIKNDVKKGRFAFQIETPKRKFCFIRRQ